MRKSQSGIGLLEAVIAVGIMGAAAAGFATIMTNANRSQRSIEMRMDLAELTRAVGQTDCTSTMSAANLGMSAATFCNGTNKLQLLGAPNRWIFGGTPPAAINGGALNSARPAFGGWYIIATCTNSTIVVDAARMVAGSTTTFMKDPQNTALVYNFSHAKARIFGGATSPALCSNSINGTPTFTQGSCRTAGNNTFSMGYVAGQGNDCESLPNSTYIASNLSSLQTQITALSGTVGTHTTQIATLNSQTATNTSNIAVHATQLTAHTTQLTTHTAQIATNTSNIATNTSNIAAHATQLSTHTTQIGTLNGTVVGHTTQIGNLNATVLAHSGQITALNTTVGTHTGQIGTLNVTVNNHATRLANSATFPCGAGFKMVSLNGSGTPNCAAIGAGGGYMQVSRDYAPANGVPDITSCWQPNVATGNCTCPVGTGKVISNGSSNGCGFYHTFAGWAENGPVPGSLCSWQIFVCTDK